MAVLWDIFYINWTKYAFVASLRAIFGKVATAAINMSGGITPSSTSIVYDTDVPVDPFMNGDYIIIDNEIMGITAVDPVTKTLTVVRGAQRTLAAAHADNAEIVKAYIDPRYMYDDDEERSNIQIYTAFPIRNFKPPTIVVDAKSGDARVSYVGPQEELKTHVVNGDNHLYFSGILRLGVNIKIYAGTMTDAEKLSDAVVVFLRFFLRDKLAELRLGYTDIHFDGISTESWNDQLLYVATISIANVHSEYELIFPKSLFAFIEQLNIQAKVKFLMQEEIRTLKVPTENG